MVVLYEDIMKNRTNATAMAVLDKLKDIPAEDLITDLFVQTDNKFAQELLKKYEQQLVLSKVKPKQFTKKLHHFFSQTVKYIKQNNLYQEFFEFAHFVYTTFVRKDVAFEVLTAYQDMLLQQYTYFVPHKLIYGVKSDGQLMLTDEPYPYIDYPAYEYEQLYGNHKIDSEFKMAKLRKLYRKYGYDIARPDELRAMIFSEEMIVNMLFQMTYFIDEQTENMFPYPYHPVAFGGGGLPREWKPTSFYLEQLKTRSYFLPPKGVLARFKNADNITSILFREKFISDKIFLLFKVQFVDSGGYISGFFDTQEQICHTVWLHAHGGFLYHPPLENFILENYYHLTCDAVVDIKKAYALNIVDNLDKPVPLKPDQPMVQYLSLSGPVRSSDKKQSYVPYDKSKYTTKLAEVLPYIRKLPAGAKASPEAIQRAKELGYSIGPGETFVRPHKKKVFRKKEEEE